MGLKHAGLLSCLFLLLGSCGGTEGEGGEGQEATEATLASASPAVALSILLPGQIQENVPAQVELVALDATGEPASGFSGVGSLELSVGDLTGGEFEMVDGRAELSVLFNREGTATLKAVVGELQGEAGITVYHPVWGREPADWVFAGNTSEPDHWTFGGFWDLSVIPGDEKWIGFASTAGGPGILEAENPSLARFVSTDFGASWALDPDVPVVEDVASSTVVFEDGVFHLWARTGELSWTFSHWTSQDEGLSWTSGDCAIEVTEQVWNSAGISSPSVVWNPDGSLQLWFTGWRADEDGPHGVIGTLFGTCGGTWSTASIAFNTDVNGTWNSASVHGAHVWRDGSIWKMLFCGEPSIGDAPSIGYARSDDGALWKASFDNPVMQKTAALPTWDGSGVDFPLYVPAGSEGGTLFFSGVPADKRPRLVRALPQ